MAVFTNFYEIRSEITINKKRLTKKKKNLSGRKKNATNTKKNGSSGEGNVAVEREQEIAAQIILDKDVGSVKVENVG